MFYKIRLSDKKTQQFLAACNNGDVGTVQKLTNPKKSLMIAYIKANNYGGLMSAVLNQDIEIIRYLTDTTRMYHISLEDTELLKCIMKNVVDNDLNDVLTFILQERSQYFLSELRIRYLKDAIRIKNLSYVQIMHTRDPLLFENQESYIVMASQRGDLGMLQYLLTNTACSELNEEAFKNTLSAAVDYAQLEIVKYLLDELPSPQRPRVTDIKFASLQNLLKIDIWNPEASMIWDPEASTMSRSLNLQHELARRNSAWMKEQVREIYLSQMREFKTYNGTHARISSALSPIIHVHGIWNDFESTPYNCDFALKHKHFYLMTQMMLCFKKNNPLEYYNRFEDYKTLVNTDEKNEIYQNVLNAVFMNSDASITEEDLIL